MDDIPNDHDRRELGAIRDLVSDDPLNAQLTKDSESWVRLCRGLDGITDADMVDDRMWHLNEVRAALRMEGLPAPDTELGPVMTAGLAAVRAELEHRINLIREALTPLADLIDTDLENVRRIVTEGVRALLPEGSQYSAEGHLLTVRSLLGEFVELVAELRRRGHDDRYCWEPERVCYVLQRAEALLAGQPGVDARDIDIMVSDALPGLLAAARQTALDLDERTAQRKTGWSVP